MTDVFSFCANVTTIQDMVCRSMESRNELSSLFMLAVSVKLLQPDVYVLII